MLYEGKRNFIELGDFLFAKQILNEVPEALKNEQFNSKDDKELKQASEEWAELETRSALRFFESQSDWCFIYNNNTPTTTRDLSKAERILEQNIKELKKLPQTEGIKLQILKMTYKCQTIRRIIDSRNRVSGKIIVFPETPQPPVASGYKFNFLKNHR